MKTAPLTVVAITSTVGALSDRICCGKPASWSATNGTCKAPSSTTWPRSRRAACLERGFSSLFDYAVRELGSRGRLQAPCGCARSTARAGGVARRLADAERRRGCSGRSTGSGGAGRSPAPQRSHRQGGRRRGRRRRRDRTIRRQTLRRPYRCPPPSRSRRRWCRWGGGNWWKRRPARAPGRSARCWPTWTRNWRRRPTGCARWRRPLRAEDDDRRGQGLEQLRGLLSHVDPRMTMGQLVGRLVKEGLDRHDPSRPPRRARSGSRPAEAKANAPRTPTPEQAHGSSAPAPQTDPDAGHHAASTPESQPAVERRAASTTKDAAIPAGAAPTPARAVRPIPTSAPPPSTQEETARRAATGAKPTGAHHRHRHAQGRSPREPAP